MCVCGGEGGEKECWGCWSPPPPGQSSRLSARTFSQTKFLEMSLLFWSGARCVLPGLDTWWAPLHRLRQLCRVDLFGLTTSQRREPEAQMHAQMPLPVSTTPFLRPTRWTGTRRRGTRWSRGMPAWLGLVPSGLGREAAYQTLRRRVLVESAVQSSKKIQ